MLANPHNPTGRALARAELAAIADRCAEREAWVLADEIHAPLTLPGATHIPWLEVSDAARRWGVSVTSASKAFNLAALKTALVVTADPAARDLVDRMPRLHEHAGLLGLIAAEAAFDDGDPWLDAVIEQLAANREQLEQDLAERLRAIAWRPPQATYLAWLYCSGLGLGDEPAAAFLKDGRIALGRGLDYGAPGAGFVRLNFATSPGHLSDAVARMAGAGASAITAARSQCLPCAPTANSATSISPGRAERADLHLECTFCADCVETSCTTSVRTAAAGSRRDRSARARLAGWSRPGQPPTRCAPAQPPLLDGAGALEFVEKLRDVPPADR